MQTKKAVVTDKDTMIISYHIGDSENMPGLISKERS